MVEELRSWGHTGGNSGHIIMKSVNENAIKSLRDAVARLLGGRVIPENPPQGESQSIGRIEESGKTIRGFVKVMKSQIEDKADITIEGKDIITQWMIRWAAMLPSRFLVGKDGKTAYERRRGRRCDIPTEILGKRYGTKSLRRRPSIEPSWKQNGKRDYGLGMLEVPTRFTLEPERALSGHGPLGRSQSRNNGMEAS